MTTSCPYITTMENPAAAKTPKSKGVRGAGRHAECHANEIYINLCCAPCFTNCPPVISHSDFSRII